jgi:hypothetical protein
MESIQEKHVADTNESIRITGINRDKTRKTNGTDAHYQVYFELSGIPALVWRTIFRREWKILNSDQHQIWHEVIIDRGFLVMHCLLREIATPYLPILKKVVDATNASYIQYIHTAAVARQHRKDVRIGERNAVDDIARSLQFE